jgi:hypothetical protein
VVREEAAGVKSHPVIRRVRLVLLALVLLSHAASAEQPPRSRPLEQAKRPEKLSPEKRAFLSARAQFLYAAECAQRKSCDAYFLEDMERNFMSACIACDAADRCERARQAIRAGASTREMKLCE